MERMHTLIKSSVKPLSGLKAFVFAYSARRNRGAEVAVLEVRRMSTGGYNEAMCVKTKAYPQQGMASILITLITMIVISLIVLGFAAISRREQRQSLDQQLSAQAFYAAESAVEDAKKVIQDRLAAGQELIGKDNCIENNAGGTYPTGAATELDEINNVSYTCLKVDVRPATAQYDGVGQGSIVVPISTTQPISRLEITWQPSTAPSGTPLQCPEGTGDVFSPQSGSGAWTCGYGVLRTDLVASGGALTRAGLSNEVTSAFFVPNRTVGTGQLGYVSDRGKANVIKADCDTTAYTECTATIGNLGTGTEFSLRLSSLYRTSNVRVVAYQGSTPIGLTGLQVVVDATGKAQDVLRRIQVRVPLKATKDVLPPGYAIQSNGALCKRFNTSRTYFNIPGDIVNRDTTNPMCNPVSAGTPPVSPSVPSAAYPPPSCTANNDIIFVLDRSTSMDNRWQSDTAFNRLKEITRVFVQNSSVSDTRNHVSIVSFSTAGYFNIGLTGNQGQLISVINGLGTVEDTYYIEGLDQAASEISSSRARLGAPKVVIFISDGAPDDPKSQIRTTANNIKATGARIYSIGIASDPRIDQVLLNDMAGNGGFGADADSEADLERIINTISRDLSC